MKPNTRTYILLALALFVTLPPLTAGLQSLRLAQSQPAQAAHYYARAARLLPWRTDLWQQAGLAALQQGDYTTATQYLQRAQSLGALDPDGWYALGQAWQQSGQKDKARQVWEAMRVSGIRHAPMLSRLAEIYEAKANFDAAIAARRAQLDITPSDAQARLRLGLMLAAQADPAALTELTRAGQDDPNLEPATRSVHTALNAAFLQPDPAYQLATIGRGLAEAGEWLLAQAAFIHAIQSNRTYAEAWAWLGETRQQLGYTDGGQYVNYAYQLNPNSPMVLALYALYHQRSGEDTLAQRAFEELTRREPQNPVWWAALGSAQARSGLLPQALQSYQAAVALRPQDPAYYKLLAEFCADYDFMALEVGVSAALEARLLDPQDPETRVLQARLMLLAGYEDTALKLLDQALALDPENATATYYKGFIYFNRGEINLARTYLTLAATRDPNGSIGAQARNILERYLP